MKIEILETRIQNNGKALKAFVDIQLDGIIVRDFRVIQDSGRRPWVRHTFGSWLAIRGVSIRTIQELLGHKKVSMTMRYAHLTDGVKQEAVSLLNGLTSRDDCHKSVTNLESTLVTDAQLT